MTITINGSNNIQRVLVAWGSLGSALGPRAASLRAKIRDFLVKSTIVYRYNIDLL